jgi:hypothetical protein
LGVDPTLKRDLNDEMLDAESVFIYKAVKKCNREVQIITELVYPANIDFLMPPSTTSATTAAASENPKITTLYAAGEVYSSSFIDTLTCQAFFNPHIVTILQ